VSPPLVAILLEELEEPVVETVPPFALREPGNRAAPFPVVKPPAPGHDLKVPVFDVPEYLVGFWEGRASFPKGK
jgi:hypothetical protein